MSTIATFYNTTFTNTRKSTGSPTGTDSVTTIGSFLGVERPVTEVAKLFVETNIGREFDIVCDEDTNVRVGDIIYASGIARDVLGVTPYEDLEDDSDSYLNIRVAKK